MAASSEILDLFVSEASEMVRELEQGLILLERSPRDVAIVNRVFRAVHTLKGNAGIVDMEALAVLAHAMESLLDGVRKGSIQADEPVFTALLAGLDKIRSMVDEARLPEPPDRMSEVVGIKERLNQLGASGGSGNVGFPGRFGPPAEPVMVPKFLITMQFAEDVLEGGHDPVLLLEELAQVGTVESVVVHVDSLPEVEAMDVRKVYLAWDVTISCPRGRKAVDDLFSFLPGGNLIVIRALDEHSSGGAGTEPRHHMPLPGNETQAPGHEANETHVLAGLDNTGAVSGTSRFAEIDPPRADYAEIQRETVEPQRIPDCGNAAEPVRTDTVRVNVKVLDRLMTIAGEMVLTRNQLLQSTRDEDFARIERASQRVDLITAELQDAVMATRMQSIRVVFDRFQRSVRDMARDMGKRIRLVIDDEGVELDKTVIEAISDPMSHLVRNAVDHGIEMPERRVAAGKSPEGTLKLRAWQAAGQVIVDVIDDGRGIDVEQVRAKAVRCGVITADEARSMPDRRIRELIFRPGFTTRDSVTQVSGRGVGLDVVTANLSAIGGSVSVESEPGHGCAFRIRLPLTLAIVPTLLIEAEGERFAIPQVNLVELVRIRAADVATRIERVGGVDVMRLRDQIVPVVRLRDVLEIDNPTWSDGISPQRHPERRRLLADRRSGEIPSAADAERRKGADRRGSFGSAMNMAIISAGDETYGLVVDSLLDSVEIVVKPLGRNLNDCQCYAGATVLGDGRASLILDVAGVARKAGIARKAAVAASRRDMNAETGPVVDKLPVLMVKGGSDELFGVPLDMVERIRKVHRSEISVAGGKKVLRGTRTTTPIFAADEMFPAAPLPDSDFVHVVLFHSGQKEYGLVVLDVADIMEIDTDFDVQTHRQRGVCGSAVIGDRVMLILDLLEMTGNAAPASPVESSRSASGSRKKRLLIVEDSTFFLNHVSALLEEAGYETVKAENGLIGLEKLTQAPESFDLVVTDIEMPEMDGFEMVSRIRRIPALKNIPVVAVTSLLGTESRQRGRDAGIDEYCVKLDREDVLSRISLLLSRKRPG